MKKITVLLIVLSGSYLASGEKIIYKVPQYTIFSNGVVEGQYSTSVISPTELRSDYPSAKRQSDGTARWQLQADVSAYPQLHSSYPLADALYNLSLEELHFDIRRDRTFMAGAQWDGVWTRDISYSILLSLAAIEPEIAKRSLLAKVKRERIVQDTGTGGSWPVSTDRAVWALAAWEIYCVTGNRSWLQHSFEVIRNSAEDDEKIIFARDTGLVHGESSFLDWREQTYPTWMQPIDIYTAQALGTNAVHYRMYRILAQMAQHLGRPSSHYTRVADQIRESINRRLWQEDAGYYGQYLYGRRHLVLSPRSEALGEELSVLFGVAPPERQDQILRSVPVMAYGIPCVFPQTAGIPPYHNDAVWPFVEAFWGWAGAKRQNEAVVLQSIASIYRASALFLTNKENMVASTGSNQGTQINSDRQLWSVAGNLALVYRILFGMEFDSNALTFHPVVPKELDGQYALGNFHYRDAVLTVRIQGHGSRIESFKIDGRSHPARIESSLAGTHEIDLQLSDDRQTPGSVHLVEDAVAPITPVVRLSDGMLNWAPVANATRYHIYRDGKLVRSSEELVFPVDSKTTAEYQVAALDAQGRESFLSEPVDVNSEPIVVHASQVSHESGAGGGQAVSHGGELAPPDASAVQLDRDQRRDFSMRASVAARGRYDIRFRYSNGNGPVNTDNKCAIRTLFVDGRKVGAIVMPQRGKGQWSNWGFSNTRSVELTNGRHLFELRFEPEDENMNPDVNQVLLESLYLQAHR